MRFLTLPVHRAQGTVLAHSVRCCEGRMDKGTVLDAAALTRLAAGGVAHVQVVQLAPDDVPENDAAAQAARAVAGSGVVRREAFTGRCNLHAATDGVLVLDAGAVDRFNAVDEALTIATLMPWSAVRAGEMVSTVKVIPFGVRRDRLDQACLAAPPGAMLRVQPYVRPRVRLIQTRLAHTRETVLDKTRETLVDRLLGLSDTLQLVNEVRCNHAPAALAQALSAGEADLLIVCGASAIADPDDVLPSGLRLAQGRVTRIGLPVDPGNLLMLGELNGSPVIGMPGCARSPKRNGFDGVLARCAAGSIPTSRDLAGLGVGGLLAEITTRPRPRDPAAEPHRPLWP